MAYRYVEKLTKKYNISFSFSFECYVYWNSKLPSTDLHGSFLEEI